MLAKGQRTKPESGKTCKESSRHTVTKQRHRPDLLLELEDRLRSVQAENQLLGRVVQDIQAEKENDIQKLSAATEAQHQAEHTAALEKQKADDLQHQLAAAQQEQQRLRSSLKAQANVLEKSRSMQDDMADVLLSLKQESEDRGRKLSAATKRVSTLKDKLKHAERHLTDTQHQRSCQEEEARAEACSHQQAMKGWRGESERLRANLASTQQQLQEARCNQESDAAASGEAYQSLQARQQALQSSLAEHSVQSNASQNSLAQQVQSVQTELQAVKQERDMAMAGLKALHMCDERRKCSLHVGLSQIGEVRQQVIEAHQRCNEQQATMVQLHDRLLSARQERQTVASKEVSGDSTSSNAHQQAVAARHAVNAAQEAEVSVMRSLQSELRRVHVLERMCLSDVTEINTLHHQLHASQLSAWALRECILTASMCQTAKHSGNVAVPALCAPFQ